jgi:hypothetical protein
MSNTRFSNVESRGMILQRNPVTTVNTAAAVTLTPAMLASGLILRDPNGASRTDVAPDATSLYEYFKNPEVGSSFEFTIRNIAGGAFTITIGGTPTGVTYNGNMTIAQNNSKRFKVVFTSPTTYTLYSLGTSVL